jgi:hypothetical protein
MELNPIIDNLIDSPLGMYWIAASTIIGSLVAIASVIVPFTATPKDDEILAKVKTVLARLSILKPKA